MDFNNNKAKISTTHTHSNVAATTAVAKRNGWWMNKNCFSLIKLRFSACSLWCDLSVCSHSPCVCSRRRIVFFFIHRSFPFALCTTDNLSHSDWIAIAFDCSTRFFSSQTLSTALCWPLLFGTRNLFYCSFSFISLLLCVLWHGFFVFVRWRRCNYFAIIFLTLYPF